MKLTTLLSSNDILNMWTVICRPRTHLGVVPRHISNLTHLGVVPRHISNLPYLKLRSFKPPSSCPHRNISHYFPLQTWVVSSYPALACPNTRAVKTGSLAGKPFVFIIVTISVACLMSPLSQTHASSR